MNKNQFIGFLLIGVIMFGFYFFTKPSKKQIEEQRRQDSIAQIQNQQKQNLAIKDSSVVNYNNLPIINDSLPDSVKNQIITNQFGAFAPCANGTEKTYTIENNRVIVKISSKGAKVYSVEVKDYKTYDQKPLVLFDGKENNFSLNFFANEKLIATQNLYFTATSNDSIVSVTTKANSLKLRAKVNENKYIEYVYTLVPDSYLVDFKINFINLDDIIPIGTTFMEVNWSEMLNTLERGDKWERQNVFLFYKLAGDKTKSLKNTKDSTQENITTGTQWVSFKQQFFNSTLINYDNFETADLSVKQLKNDSLHTNMMFAKLTVPFSVSKASTLHFSYYFGPNKFSILRKIKINNKPTDLVKLIPLGGTMLAWINIWFIIPLFNFLGQYIANFGIIILLLTIIIKILLFPLTHKTYQSTAKMRILKPELDKVLEKIPADKQMDRQQATMALYKKAGVNPMGGCLPTLLQFPILFALYRFFPASIELRQKSFLWVKDLSTYDSIAHWNGNIPIVNWIFGNHISLWTLLMAVSMLINTWITNKNQATNSADPQAKTMKFMMYLMPLMMIVWFNGYSAALSYYFFLSTLIGTLQMLVSQKLVNEEKVLSQLRANIKKTKEPEKSKFQQRLEEMQRQQNNSKRK